MASTERIDREWAVMTQASVRRGADADELRDRTGRDQSILVQRNGDPGAVLRRKWWLNSGPGSAERHSVPHRIRDPRSCEQLTQSRPGRWDIYFT